MFLITGGPSTTFLIASRWHMVSLFQHRGLARGHRVGRLAHGLSLSRQEGEPGGILLVVRHMVRLCQDRRMSPEASCWSCGAWSIFVKT